MDEDEPEVEPEVEPKKSDKIRSKKRHVAKSNVIKKKTAASPGRLQSKYSQK